MLKGLKELVKHVSESKLFTFSVVFSFSYILINFIPIERLEVINSFMSFPGENKKKLHDLVFDLSLGFIVSFIFYIIVVFMPEYKKRKRVLLLFSHTFDSISLSISEYIYTVLDTFSLPVENSESIDEKFLQECNKCFYYFILKSPKDHLTGDIGIDELILSMDPTSVGIDRKQSYLELLQGKSKEILNYQKELIAFIPYMDSDQVETFSRISNISIFPYITSNEISTYKTALAQDRVKGFKLQKQFFDDFKKILKIHQMLIRSSSSQLKTPFPYSPASRKNKYREYVFLECRIS